MKYKKCHGDTARRDQSATPARNSAPRAVGGPRVLYKFMERRWAVELTTKGNIQIGTLNGFRKAEAHRPGIGDTGEGTRVLQSGPRWTNRGEDLDLPGIKLEGVSPGTFTLKNVSFVGSVRNALIICLAGHSGAKGFPPEYDTIVEIADPRGFLNAVNDDLEKTFSDLRSLGLVECVYAAREAPLSSRVSGGGDAWFRKPVGFQLQSEFRAGWVTEHIGDEPIVRVVPKLCNFVRILP